MTPGTDRIRNADGMLKPGMRKGAGAAESPGEECDSVVLIGSRMVVLERFPNEILPPSSSFGLPPEHC